MERLLLIFIVIGNVLPHLYALPHQEVNSEEFDEAKKNYNDIISLDEKLANSVVDVPKKSGRTIHQTAWSKENNEDEPNSVVKEADQTNSSKNSWNLSQLLKLLLKLVHNREEDKAEEIIKNGKDNGKSKSKAPNSNKPHKPVTEALKSRSIVQKKHNKKEKNNEAEINSISESNSYTSNPFDKSYKQKKQNSGMLINSSKGRNIEKTTQSRPTDIYSSRKFENVEFSKIEQPIDELNLKESNFQNSMQYIDENYYYDDEDNEEDEYCDSYSSSFSSEKAAISQITLNEITEDSYEAGSIEVSDDDYLKVVSGTTSKLISKISTETSINQDETVMQEGIINQVTKNSYDATILSNEENIHDEKDAKIETNKQFSIHDITTIQKQAEDDLKDDNIGLDILSSSRSNEISILQIGSISPKQNVTLTTKSDQVVLEKPDFQNNNTYVTSSYIPLMESTVQKGTDQSFTSQQTHIQSTTPFAPYTNTEFQSQLQNELKQKTLLQETPSNTKSTQGESFSKKPSFDEEFLATKTSDAIQIHKPVKMNFTFQAENYSTNNQETTQELLQSLPLSSSGEFITNTEKDQPLSIPSKMNREFSHTAEKNRQFSIASGIDRPLLNTSESDRQLSDISERKQQLSNTSQETTPELLQSLPLSSSGEFITNTEKDQQLSIPSKMDREFSYTSEKNRQLSITSVIDRPLSNTSENDRQLSDISEREKQLSNTTVKNRQLSITSENDRELSNVSEIEQQLSHTSELVLLETDSKNTNPEHLKSQKDFTQNGRENTQSKSSSLFYTFTKEQGESPNPHQNVIVFENEKLLSTVNGGAKNLMPDKTSQIINKFADQQNGLQKDNANFISSQALITPNNEADENLGINQTGDSLVNEVSNRYSGSSVIDEETSKNIGENQNDDEYYEFEADTTSVITVSENDQNSLELVKTTPLIKKSDQNNINLPSESEKPYDTILQFLYKHSNSSFIQSLREN